MAARVPAIGRRDRQSIVVVHVAGNARCPRWGNVHPCQGKAGRAVIEGCRRPAYCVMAHRTVRRRKLRTRRRVDGIIRLLPGR